MEYYIISLIITIILFGIIQFFEYKRIKEENEYSNFSNETYSLFTNNNILLISIIYTVITIGSYLLYSSNINLSSYFKFNFKNKNDINSEPNYKLKEELNPHVISKINDNFDIGLDPFNSDNSSVSSLTSSNSSSLSTSSLDN